MRKLITFSLLISVYAGLIAPFSAAAQHRGAQDETPDGLKFRLSAGKESNPDSQGGSKALAQPLDDPSGLVRRLPPIKVDASDATDFAKRAGSIPPPKTGTKIPVKFPADFNSAPPVDSGRKLEVVRFSPEGEVGIAPDLSVTFSHPMVAVSSQEEAAAAVPVELAPQVNGRWRWIGTKTLLFDAEQRLPMATRFTARVPKGTRSATGLVLDRDVVWTFTTPPPAVETMFPINQITKRDAIIYLVFDQKVNPEAVLPHVTVSSRGRRLPVRLATAQEQQGDGGYSSSFTANSPYRWMALRAVNADGSTADALPAASPIVVTVKAGTPSAEGPLTTQKDQVFTFTTFGPFEFLKVLCGWDGKQQCSPFDSWYVQFNNGLDTTKFDPKMVKIEPAIEGVKIYPSGSNIYIEGYKKGNTNYRLTIDPAVADYFGQSLGKAVTATVRVGAAPTSFYAQGGPMIILDPAAPKTFSIYSTNHSAARVRIYSVAPSDWPVYREFAQRLNYNDATPAPPMPGRLVSDRTVKISGEPDQMTETRIDLNPALTAGLGHVVVHAEPAVRLDKDERARVVTWVQSTQIGLDAFIDRKELVGFATDLKTGKPLADVQLSIQPNGVPGEGVRADSDVQVEESLFTQAWNWIAGLVSRGPSVEHGNFEDAGSSPLDEIQRARSDTTGRSGVLRLPLPQAPATGVQNYLLARRGADTAFLPENASYYWNQNSSWFRREAGETLRWFVFDDRKTYKPGEEVSVKGYVRLIDQSELGDVRSADALAGHRTIFYSINDPQGEQIGKGTAEVNTFGAFDLKAKLPHNVNLGGANVQLRLLAPGETEATSHSMHTHYFQIQEFRRPEFEVTAKVETPAPHFVKDAVMIAAEAKYYAGGGLANADTNWTVTATPTNYIPPNRGDYVFGVWTPWWFNYDIDGAYGRGGLYGRQTQSFTGKTDAEGRHLLKVDFDSVSPARPYAISASAAVQDVNRQTWAGQASLLLHPSSLYVGIKSPRTFVQRGEVIPIEAIVTNLEGDLIANRAVKISAVLKDWVFEKGVWKESVIDEQTCNEVSGARPIGCSFTAKAGGRYLISATVLDDRERANYSELTVWVAGGKTPPKRNVEMERVQVIPSKKDFAPGDVAELLVLSPFAGAEGILTLRREGIVKVERFSIKESSATLRIPLEEAYLPNIVAQVDLVGSSPRQNDKGETDPSLPPRPAYASGEINIPISLASRKLTVSAEAADKSLTPGGRTKVSVSVTDSNGEPAPNTEVAVVVVDESVLALSNYSIGSPLETFYSTRGEGTVDLHSRQEVLLANPEDARKVPPPPPGMTADVSVTASGLSAMMASPKARAEERFADAKESSGTGEAAQGAIELRQNFEALALWSPAVVTDGRGRAVIDLKLPDNLTRYRITAVAADKHRRFGKGESDVTARKPLMIRPSAPRFLNFGDKALVPVVVQNQTDQAMTVDVAVRASNARLLESTGVEAATVNSAGKRVVVNANDRVEIQFPVATISAGTARFQFAASSGALADAAEISLPVWTPATSEAFATYGTTDQNGAIFQPVKAPENVFPQFGGLEVTTSSTQLQELTDAYIYLANYPYGCSEQIASRMISTAALRDVLTAFKSKDMPSPEALRRQFENDIAVLKARQRDDGSFGLWKRERERYEYPFLTIHVAHALGLAKAKGYAVPDEMLSKAAAYLKNIERHFDQWHKDQQVRWTISAYALYVRGVLGDNDAAKAKKILAEAKADSAVIETAAFNTKLNLEALGWILSVLASDPGSRTEVEQISRYLMNRTTETASTANFVTNYDDGAWLIMHSNRRADGILLSVLLKAAPQSDLIPKIVRGLLANRTKGHWGSTQENVFILLALDKYFSAYESITPEFVARVWLGEAYAGEQSFVGRSIDSKQLNIPMSYMLDQGGAANLVIDRQGAGRLYYRIGMKYAPKNLRLMPADYGFTVLRRYEAIDDKGDVRQNADGSWTIRSGARVRVRLTMVAQARRYHVALVDYLPAAFEILNPDLATTEAIPVDDGQRVLNSSSRFGGRSIWPRGHWVDHQNFRDERAEAFSALLWEGVYNYSFVVRATTPGEFIAPPAKAEEMYMPETFGRSGTDIIKVE